MPYIEIPVNPAITRPMMDNVSTFGMPADMRGKGADKGVPVTNAQINFDQYSGRLPHDAMYRRNRWVNRYLDYDKLRAMRRDPTIALAREMAVAPIQAMPWLVELTGGDEKHKLLVERYLAPMRSKLVRTAVYGEIDFGWRAYEKVMNLVKDKELGNVVVPVRIKTLLNDNTWARFDDEGDFNGLIHRDPNNGEWFVIDEPHSLFCNFDDDGLGYYNDPRLIRAESAYDQWNTANAAAMRYDDKIAGAVWVVHYPEGRSKYKGERKDNYDIAVDIVYQLKASGHLILPSRLLADVETEMDEMGQPPWRVELIESGGQQGNFETRLNYLDKLKTRGLGVLERAMMEGNYGTKAEAESHFNVMLLNMYLKAVDLADFYTKELVNQITALKYDEVDTVKIIVQPLSDERKQMFQTMFTAFLADPEMGQQIQDSIDLSAIMEGLKLPMLAPEQRGGDNSIAGLFKLIGSELAKVDNPAPVVAEGENPEVLDDAPEVV